MRKFALLGMILSAVLLIGGCEKKIDASSKEAFDKSTKELAEGLDDAKKEEFAKALQTVGLAKVAFAKGDPDANAKATFDGKSVDEVIAEAKKIQAENKASMDKLMSDK